MERVELADGLTVHALNAGEARFLHDEIFEEGAYLRHGIELSDGAVVLDVGANIGMFSLYLAQRWQDLTLVCFEPMPAVFEALEANMQLHDVEAQLLPIALGDHEGEVTFTFYPANSVMSSRHADQEEDRSTTGTFLANRSAQFARLHSNERLRFHAEAMMDRLFQAEEVQCAVRRLSDVIADLELPHIDLLKVDVEKAEHEVLAGIDDADWERIRQLAVEVHDVDGRLDAMVHDLEQRGYTVTRDQDADLAGTAIHNVYARRTG